MTATPSPHVSGLDYRASASARRSGSLVFIVALSILSGCASRAFVATPVDQAGFLERAVVQTQQTVRVAAAVPDAKETLALTGLDLYQQGIQPVWLEVTNLGEQPVRTAVRSVDENYFSPMEVAWKYRKRLSEKGRADMERWFFENQLPRRVPAGETRSGFVFTHLAQGTKGFNFDVYSSESSHNFTFFVPIPGFFADYMDVDFQSMYEDGDIVRVDTAGLREALKAVPCCSLNASGDSLGDPLNVVIVGTALAVRRSLLRAQWQETALNAPETTVARTHRFLGRPPDGTFLKSRPDGSERKELRLWLAPLLVNDSRVLIGQVSYEMAGASGVKAYENHRMDPDVDNARDFLMQNFWYSQSLGALASVGGVPRSSISAPLRNFAGAEYFTDGQRVVLFVSENPVAMDQTDILPWRAVLTD
ncbi:MAG: hypothetical protein AMJ66_03675 [Betaproteobacteria bacterium SG8_40]|nr:MAG: hypothetical protein AMJ66_03675 [Betaproteobacteria bacterium SG8_40]